MLRAYSEIKKDEFIKGMQKMWQSRALSRYPSFDDGHTPSECGSCVLRKTDLRFINRHEAPSYLASRLGLPDWILPLQELIFEKMSSRDYAYWTVSFFEAIPKGACVEDVRNPFLAAVLERSLEQFTGRAAAPSQEVLSCVAAVKDVVTALRSGDGVKLLEACRAVRDPGEIAADAYEKLRTAALQNWRDGGRREELQNVLAAAGRDECLATQIAWMASCVGIPAEHWESENIVKQLVCMAEGVDYRASSSDRECGRGPEPLEFFDWCAQKLLELLQGLAMKLVLLPGGVVMVGRLEREGSECKLHRAVILHGSDFSKYVARLSKFGPDGASYHKATGIVEFSYNSAAAIIPINYDKWKSALHGA